MTRQRLTTAAIAATLALAVTAGGLAWVLRPGRRGTESATAVTATSPMRALAEGVRLGDPKALAALCQRVVEQSKKEARPLDEAEALDLIEVAKGLRVGYLKFTDVGRASSVSVASLLLDRFKVEPAPACWVETLRPAHEIFLAALADAGVDPRVSALNEVGKNWNYLPGRAMTPFEEATLDDWKQSFHAPAVRRLADPEARVRASAVVCLGAIPIDALAAPAVVHVEDAGSGGVRYKTLMTFANRPNLLTADMVLKRLHDPEVGVPELAEIILKARGLTKDQIFLGRQMYSDRPETRASVMPLLQQRTDIDPDVWLIQLSHDADETVRAKAVEALMERSSPEVDRRLREIAASDPSPVVRAAAGKHASLPPLPGSSSLNPKAN